MRFGGMQCGNQAGAGPVHVIREADPSNRGGLFNRYRDRAVRSGIGGGVPYHLVEEPRRGNDRQHTRRACERLLDHARLQKAERQVDRRGGRPMLVEVDLTSVQCDPQPDPLQVRVRAIVPAQLIDQRGRQRFHEEALGHLRADQDEHAVAAVLVIAVSPWNTRPAECLPHRTVQSVTDGQLIPVGAMPISKSLDVDSNDGPVNGQAHTLYLPSPRENKAEANPSLTREPTLYLSVSPRPDRAPCGERAGMLPDQGLTAARVGSRKAVTTSA